MKVAESCSVPSVEEVPSYPAQNEDNNQSKSFKLMRHHAALLIKRLTCIGCHCLPSLVGMFSLFRRRAMVL